ncbi:MAG: YifB family Mg chelatase-like AAA ATPase [Candidatus Omnitrophica bacterium]|nr:YifB family Mg chelatase-like AAA ATPase [Candidatus Omnitrophota bacterium]
MLAKVESRAVVGIEPHRIIIEVDASSGLPNFSMVGLPDAAVRESRDRVRSAIKNSGFHFPAKRITINLSPANIRKEGPSFDLPIALGLLASTGELEEAQLKGRVFCGELSLDGKVQRVKGVLPIAMGIASNGKSDFIVGEDNADEAAVVEGLSVYPAKTLLEVVKFLKGECDILPKKMPGFDEVFLNPITDGLDFSDVKGQAHVKRGLEVAAAGSHNVLMIGPPGSGKSMLAKRFATILPNMSLEEALEATKIHSVAGTLNGRGPILKERSFRSPHHTISYAGLIGGGAFPRPGEVSLAHNGVLFLDELPELRRDALEALRQPLEDGFVTIARAQGSLNYPARFTLLAAMNPCPCGFFTDPKKECRCNSRDISRYLSKISGPLLDRIDIQLDVPQVKYAELTHNSKGESSKAIRERVNGARARQLARFKGMRIFTNSQMASRDIRNFCALEDGAEEILKRAVLEFGLSARAYHRVLKVGLTIADLGSSDIIKKEHILEAIQYRALGNQYE